MKYVAFMVIVLGAVPVMTALGMWSERWRGWLVTALVFSTALGDLANVNFVSLELYRGPDRGYEINLADLIALALALALAVRLPRRVRWLPYNMLPLALLFVGCVVATVIAPAPLLGTFTLFKLVRVFIVYWAVANALETGVPSRAVWRGFVLVAVFLTTLALKQKYVDGLYRVHASFDHSNTIPLYANLVLPVLLMWAMVDRGLDMRRAAVSALAAMGLTVTVMATFSRAGLALSVFGIVGALLASARRAPRRRLLPVVSVVLVAGLLGGAVAADSLIDRFLNAPESSAEARSEFNEAAIAMAREHPLGVGLNNFSRVLTDVDRYRAGITVMKGEEQAGVAHHIYLLTAAELGYVGLLLFLLIMARFTWRGGWHGLKARTTDAMLARGLMLGLCTLHAAGLLEWAFRTTPVMYMTAIVCACTVAFTRRASGSRGAVPA